MKRTLYLIVVFIVIAAISGCVTAKKVVRERVDQKITGNRGYIQGQPLHEPSVARSKTREYIDIRVEIPTLKELGLSDTAAEKTEGTSAAEEPSEVYAPAEEEEESKYIK